MNLKVTSQLLAPCKLHCEIRLKTPHRARAAVRCNCKYVPDDFRGFPFWVYSGSSFKMEVVVSKIDQCGPNRLLRFTMTTDAEHRVVSAGSEVTLHCCTHRMSGLSELENTP